MLGPGKSLVNGLRPLYLPEGNVYFIRVREAHVFLRLITYDGARRIAMHGCTLRMAASFDRLRIVLEHRQRIVIYPLYFHHTFVPISSPCKGE
jgi:hypothetical protein